MRGKSVKLRKASSAVLALLLTAGLLPAVPARAAGFRLRGDVNADGVFDIADAVLLQKWLLAVPDTHPADWQAADLSGDDRLDGTDFCLMKRALTDPANAVQISAPACKAAAFACADDGQLLYADRVHARIAPASLTKLLTASVALHYLEPDTVVTVGTEQELVKPRSSLCLIKPGHRLKLCDLLTGMLMASGNDAAYTAAVAVARAVQPGSAMTDAEAVTYFTALMNDYADKIGMTESHFTTPEGWDDAAQYTTVSDLLILADHAFSVPALREITGTHRKKVYFVSGENADWTNTNALLNPDSAYYCPDAAGLKTGSTSGAGNCLIAAFVRGGRTYLSVAAGCPAGNDRYLLTLEMLSRFVPDAGDADAS